MPWNNDEAIVKLAQRGEALAWTILVRRYQDPLVALLISRLGDPVRAHALARRAFADGKSELIHLKDRERFPEWITDLAFRLAKSRTEIPPETSASPPLSAEGDNEAARDTLEHLRRLPETLRDPLLLQMGAGLNYEAIAGFLNLPLETIRDRIATAREKLLRLERRKGSPGSSVAERYRRLLAAWVDSELQQSDGREVDIHVAKDENAREYAAELTRQRDLLRSTLGRLMPRSDLWTDAQAPTESALLTVKSGDTFVDGRPHQIQTAVRPGSRLKTPLGSENRLHLPDGSVLRMGAESRLHYQFGEAERKVVLESGSLETFIVPEPRPFVIETPLGRITAHAARISVNAGGRLSVDVTSGHVSFSNDFGDCRIYSGGSVTVSSRDSLPRPTVPPSTTRLSRQMRRGAREFSSSRPTAAPTPFIERPPASLFSRLVQTVIYGFLGLLAVTGAVALILLWVARQGTGRWEIDVAACLPAQSTAEMRMAEAERLEAALRYLLWGHDRPGQAAPQGRLIEARADAPVVVVEEVDVNVDRARVFVQSRYEPGSVDLTALKDDVVYTLVIALGGAEPDSALAWRNREIRKQRIAANLSESLGLRVESRLQPFHSPHIACPPDSADRLAVTAEGRLLQRVAQQVRETDTGEPVSALADTYDAGNAAHWYAALAGSRIDGCTDLPAELWDPDREAIGCYGLFREGLDHVTRIAGSRRCRFELLPVSALLAVDSPPAPPFPEIPPAWVRLLGEAAVSAARAGDATAGLELLVRLHEAAADYRNNTGEGGSIAAAARIEWGAFPAWSRFLGTVKDATLCRNALESIRRHRDARTPPSPTTTLLPLRDAVPEEASTQWDRLADCANRLLVTRAALERARLETGAYPASIQEATPFLDAASPPTDPYTGAPFHYETDGRTYRLWSPGPDGIDQQGQTPFDPSNGWTSEGDVVMDAVIREAARN